MELRGILPIRLTKKNVKNKKNKINLPTLDLTAESRASLRIDFREEKRLE
jgi:hypothetical protein